MIFLFLILFILLIVWARRYIGERPKASTSNGAIIMAGGILINGAMKKMPVLAHLLSHCLALALLPVIGWLAIEYGRDARDGSFVQRHLSNPVSSFGTGTWIAALSVTAVSLKSTWPGLKPAAELLLSLSVVLLIPFILLVIRNYVCLFKEPERRKNLNGTLLLGCVAVQSVVISAAALLKEPALHGVFIWMIILGGLLYLLGFASILSSLIKQKKIDLQNGWTNTNVIVHGAVSITGLAAVSAPIKDPDLAATFWLLATVLILIVEGIELARAGVRVHAKGWSKGLFSYHPSQWSRNFTLGMYIAFTIKAPLTSSFLSGSTVSVVQHQIIGIGKYVVLILFVIELFLGLKHLMLLGGRKMVEVG